MTTSTRRRVTFLGDALCTPTILSAHTTLWRALPAGAERDALARDIREAASIFAGRSFADAPIADEFPL